MAKELLKIEDIDGDVRITCDDPARMADAVGTFLYRAIMERGEAPIVDFLRIFIVLGGLLDDEAHRRGFLELVKEAMAIPHMRAISVKPNKVKS